MLINQEFVCQTIENLPFIAGHIITCGQPYNVWALEGEMGAGKTTLAKEICRLLGVIGNVQSPTFAIVNQYKSLLKDIYHFDFYRLQSQQEAYDIGYEEYFYAPNTLCLLEWSSRIPALMPPEYLRVEIELLEEGKRIFKIKAIG